MKHEEWAETITCRDLTAPYCKGNGVDLGSKGIPVVPWAIQVEIPPDDFFAYQGFALPETVEWKGTALDLPFKDGVLDFVYSSHLLEDFLDWTPILKEWIRVIKRGGYLIIMLPDKVRFNNSIKSGGNGNANHKHESYVGELSSLAPGLGLRPIMDCFTEKRSTATFEDYNILFVAEKL